MPEYRLFLWCMVTLATVLALPTTGRGTEPRVLTSESLLTGLAKNLQKVAASSTVRDGRITIQALIGPNGNIIRFFPSGSITTNARSVTLVFRTIHVEPSYLWQIIADGAPLSSAAEETLRTHLVHVLARVEELSVRLPSRAAQIAARTAARLGAGAARVGGRAVTGALSRVLQVVGSRFAGPIGEILLSPTELGWEDDPGPCDNRLRRLMSQVSAYILAREVDSENQCVLRSARGLVLSTGHRGDLHRHATTRREQAERLRALLDADIPRYRDRSPCRAFISNEMRILSEAYDVAKRTDYLEGCSGETGEITIAAPMTLSAGPREPGADREPPQTHR